MQYQKPKVYNINIRRENNSMSTRSNIGILEKDGTVYTIYCHFDGYPRHHFPILSKFSEADFRELILLGDISQLAPQISPLAGRMHSFDQPAANTVVAYHRDRGEEYHAPRKRNKQNCCEQEYAYLYDVERKLLIWSADGTTWKEAY